MPAVPDADVRDPSRAVVAPVFGTSLERVRCADRLDRTVSDHLLRHALKRPMSKKGGHWVPAFLLPVC